MLHDVLLGLALAVFGSAGATAIGVIIATIAPQWHRICRLAMGNFEMSAANVPMCAPVLLRRSLQDRRLASVPDCLSLTGPL